MATGMLEELASYCRLCGKQKSRLVSVFVKDSDGVPLRSRIVDNLLIPITEDDLLPHKICIACQKTLIQFCNFAEKCRIAQTDFKTRLAELLAKKNTPCEVACSRSFSTLTNELQVVSSTPAAPRELFVRVPRLPLPVTSRSFSEQQELEKVHSNWEKLDVYPAPQKEFEFSPTIQIKEEIKEEIPAVESILLSTDRPSKDHVDRKLELKVEELLQTSILDIPFTQESPRKPVTGCESYQNTCVVGRIDKKTFSNDICSLKNIISNIFDSQHIVIDDKDSLLNVTFSQPTHKSPDSRADVQSNFSSCTLDTQQFSNLFPNVGISDTDLKKLGAAIFYKNLPDIMKKEQIQIGSDDLRTEELREGGTSKSVTVTFDGDETRCNSNAEEMETCIPLPISCTVELVNIKPELEAVKEDLSLPKNQDIQPTETSTLVWQDPQLKISNQNTVNAHHLSTTGIDENCAEETSELVSRLPSPEMKVPRIVLSPLSSSLAADNIANSEKRENGFYGLFTCRICQKQFNEECLLTKHTNDEHAESYACDFCDATFPQQDALQTHFTAAHSKSRSYSCKTCKSNFASEFGLEKHKCSGRTDLTCTRCSYVAKDQYRLTQHLKEVHDKRLECDICGERFGKKSKIESHLQNYHTECKPVQCSRCNLTFTQRHYWKEHMKTHSSDSHCICTYCGLKFDKKYKLSLHISKTHELKEIRCTQCSSFTTLHKYHLTQHIREVHNKKFVCHHCGKFESKKCRIVIHIRNNHTTKKKYRCTFKNCRMTYNSKCWFREHMKKHQDK